MGLTGNQKRYLKKHPRREPLWKIAAVGNFLKQHWKTLAFLAFLVFAVYLNSLGNDFVADDVPAIINNENLGNFGHILSQPLQFIRPLLYFIAYKIGGLNPFFYRTINILFHIGTVWLVYLLLGSIATLPLALFTATLFAVHPLLTESVTWISGGVHTQYSFFVLLAFFLYILYLNQKNWKTLTLSLLAFIFALISSEKAIIFPLILFVFLIAFQGIRKKWPNLIPFGVVAFLFGLIYLGGISQRATALQSQFYHKPGITNPLVQVPIAITSYLELIFWPKNLTLYHSEMSFTQEQFLIRLIIFITFIIFIIFSFFKNRPVFFWLSFFIISLFPTLIPLGIAWIVAERYVYLGTLGIFVLTALAIQKIGEVSKNPKVSYVILAIIILLLGARTIVRNADWKNQDTLWLATAKTSPSSPQNHNNLGDYYGRHGNLEKAVEEFKRAIELLPGYADAYHNLGNTYQQMGKTAEAIENYQKAILLNPNLWQSYQNLAAIYFSQEKFELAEEQLKKAVKINPQNANLYLNLGIVYLKLEEREKAKGAFYQALRLDPQNQKLKQLLLTLP